MDNRNGKSIRRAVSIGCAFLLVLHLSACQSNDGVYRDGPTARMSENAIRYGSIAAAGAGAGYATNVATGSTAATVAASAGGAGFMWGIHKFLDFRRKRSYQNGYEDGAAAARAEYVQEVWQREAVEGRTAANGHSPFEFVTRRVFVPSRTMNGVTYPAGYQVVQVIPE